MITGECTNIAVKRSGDLITVDIYDDFGGESFDLTIEETKTLIGMLNISLST